MSIFPLPQFEADLEAARKADEEAYARLRAPTSMVVRFGAMRMIAELAYDGEITPGCGTKVVAKTQRGTELAEMLTSTCPNAGCGKSITRKEMLAYIEESGGKDYPFFDAGRVLRIATSDDLARQTRLDEEAHQWRRAAHARAGELGLDMRVVQAEPILGGEMITFFYTADERVDFRELLVELRDHHGTHVELRQIGARDEARLVADYERCGQHCCCRQFLKVLKPVSMRSAKTQKATLDPLKISGRCGRLMCCLRYEDQTYTELRKRLPKRKKRVGTTDGPGIVVDSQILTQLVQVQIERTGERVALPVEELIPLEEAEEIARQREAEAAAAMERAREAEKLARKEARKRRRERKQREAAAGAASGSAESAAPAGSKKKKRKRKRRKGEGGAGDGPVDLRERAKQRQSSGDADGPGDAAPAKRKRRRRRKRSGGGGDSGGGEASGG